MNVTARPTLVRSFDATAAPDQIKEERAHSDLEAILSLARLMFQTEYCFLNLKRSYARSLTSSSQADRSRSFWAELDEGDEKIWDDLPHPSVSCCLPDPSTLQEPQFVASSPLLDRAGAKIGSLCVAFEHPREALSPREHEAMHSFSEALSKTLQRMVSHLERLQAVEGSLRFADTVRDLLESTTECVFVLDADWVFTFVNRCAVRTIMEGRDLRGLNFWVSFPKCVSPQFEQHLREAVENGVPISFETSFADEKAMFEVRIQPKGGGIAIFFRDVTEQRKIALELQRVEARYRLATLSAVDGIWDWDHMTGQTYFSARWQEIIGLPPLDFTTDITHWFDRLHPKDLLSARDIYNASNPKITSEFTREYRIRHENGQWRWILSHGTVVRDETGRSLRTVGSNRDITHQRSRDPLSSLHNRSSLLEQLERRIEDADGTPKTFALLLFDIDQFQNINDRFGDRQGDLVLIDIAARLESTLGEDADSLVARVKGDEFAVLLSNIVEVEDAATYAQCLHMILGGILYQTEPLYLTISIGIAMGDEGSHQAEQLLQNAGIAMHQAKSQGQAMTVVFDADMRSEKLRRVQLEIDLRSALLRNQFVLFYQPKVRLESGVVTAYEALVRWIHPVRGLIPPLDFIPHAEQSGLIINLGEWTLREAVRQLMHWRSTGFVTPDVTMAVNLSPRQFSDQSLCAKVRDALESHNAPSACLTLEVTESATIDDLDQAKRILQSLRELGVGLDLDDFGTGYSSLSYLQRLPFQSIKIDRSFTRNLEGSPESRAIAQSIIQLGTSLGLAVIAEGIETEAQRTLLLQLGCHIGQGFFYSRPLPAAELEEKSPGPSPRRKLITA